MIYRRFAAFLLMGLCASGCNQRGATATGSNSGSNFQAQASIRSPLAGFTPSHLDHAQPKLTTIKLWVGPEVLETELALRSVEVATGMMFRTDMGENEGMLFAFARPYRVSFYMKNTRVPLSAAYIDPDGRIVEIHDLQPLDENPVFADSDRIQYVLEVKQGWFKRHNVAAGSLIRTELGALSEVFHQ